MSEIGVLPLPTTSKPKRTETYQPTYQLFSHNKFNNEKVEKILQRIFKEEFEAEEIEMQYNEKQIPELCTKLSQTIRDAIKEEKFNRYRLIVIVSIGQKRQQDFTVYHSFLWDPEKDSYVTHSFENYYLFAHVVVYGIYMD